MSKGGAICAFQPRTISNDAVQFSLLPDELVKEELIQINDLLLNRPIYETSWVLAGCYVLSSNF